MKLEGVEKGIPDIFIADPRNGHYGLFIELKKRKGGTVSLEQREKIKLLNAKGYKAVVCHGAEEAMDALRQYLNDDGLRKVQ